VKNTCNGDCNTLCASKTYSSGQGAPEHQACLGKCQKGCVSSQAALAKMCKVECPTCLHRSNACHLRCLQQETQTKCNKVCTKEKKIEKCKPTCLKKEMRMSCSKVCKQKKPRKSCAKKCQNWDFSKERHCHHGCKNSGYAVKYVCDKTSKHHCVQWSGGKVCDKLGSCLRYKAIGHNSDGKSISEPTTTSTTTSTSARDVIYPPSSKTPPSTVVPHSSAVYAKGAEPIPLEPGPVIISGSHFGMKEHQPPTEQTMPPLVKIRGLGDHNVPQISPLRPHSKLGTVVQRATADVEKLLRDDDRDAKKDEEILEETSHTDMASEETSEETSEVLQTGLMRFSPDEDEAYPEQSTLLAGIRGVPGSAYKAQRVMEVVTAAESAREALAESQAELLAAERAFVGHPKRVSTEWGQSEGQMSAPMMSAPIVMIQEHVATSRQSQSLTKAQAEADAAKAEWEHAQLKELAFEQLLNRGDGDELN